MRETEEVSRKVAKTAKSGLVALRNLRSHVINSLRALRLGVTFLRQKAQSMEA